MCRALEGASGPVILVGQSMGAFTAPMVAERVDTALIVLVNPMVPTAGETPGQWWEATGQPAARVDYFKRIGLTRTEFDPIEDFFHDVPEEVRQVAMSQPEPRQSDAPFEQPWPLSTAGPTCPPASCRAATTDCFRWSFSGGWYANGSAWMST